MAGRPKIIIKQSSNKQKYTVLQAANGEALAVSEMLKSDAAVKKNIDALKKVAKTAVVEDTTKPKSK